MAIDRGGLQYRITIDDQFSQVLAKFQTDVAKAKTSWQQFRREVSQVGAASRDARRASDQLGTSASRQARASQAASDASREERRTLDLVTRAAQSLARVREQSRVIAAREVGAVRERVFLGRQSASQARVEARAAAQVARAVEREAVAQERSRLAKELNLALSADGSRLLNVEAAARERNALAAEREAIALRARQLGTTQATAAALGITPDQLRQQRAQAKFDTELENLRTRERVQALRNQSAEYQRLTQSTDQVRNSTRSMGLAARSADTHFNRISFTFRRLIGIMAAFTIARQVVQQFRNMISAAIEFNATIEQSQVGIAGLILAAGTVRDSFGQAVEGEEGFIRAQAIASEELRKLQKDAQETAATFEELARAFTTAVAPGLQAGLTLDQIRQITIQISQAAAGLGVAQDQLAEEIRSLLQGTITPRTTRIATALGISNEDIRRARELGDLFNFLEGRFAAISRSGRELINTFNAQVTNAADGFRRLLGLASTGFFRQLKDLVADFINTIQRDLGDVLEPDAQAVSAFQQLFDGLERGVLALRDALRAVNLEEIGNALGAVGQTLGALIGVLGEGINVLVSALQPAFVIFSGIANLISRAVLAFNQLVTASDSFFARTVRSSLQLLVLARTLRIVRNGFRDIVRFSARLVVNLGRQVVLAAKLAASVFATGRNFRRLVTSVRLLLAPVLILVGAFAALEELTGTKILEGVVEAIGSVLGPALAKLDELFERLLGLPDAVESGTAGLLSTVTDNLAKTQAEVDNIVTELEEAFERLRDERAIELFTAGLTSDVAQQFNNFLRIAAENRERERGLLDQIKTLQASNLKLEEKRKELVEKIALAQGDVNAQGKTQKELLFDVNLLENSILSKRKDLAAVDADLQRRRAQRFAAREEGDLEREAELARLESEALLDRQQVLAQIADLEEKKRAAEQAATADAKTRQEAAEKEKELKEELDTTVRSIAAQEQLITEVEDRKNKLLAEGNKLANERLALDAELITIARRRELAELRVEAAAAQAVASAQTIGDRGAIEVIQRRRDLTLAIVRANRLLSEQIENVNFLAAEFTAEQRKQEPDVLKQLALREQITVETEKLNLLQTQQLALIAAARAEYERIATLTQTNDFTAGFAIGLEDLANQTATLAQAGQQLALSFGENLTRILAEGIVTDVIAAFTNSENYDWRDVAASLAQDLATELLQALIASGIAELIGRTGPDVAGLAALKAATAALQTTLSSGATKLSASATSLTTSATALSGSAIAWKPVAAQLERAAVLLLASDALRSGTGGGPGPAGGGRITGAGATAYSMPFRRAQGFARGGPAHGRDPRDRIPVWARIGEWMIRPEAARYYGDRVMSLLNAGAIDARIMRQLASVSRRRGKGSSSGPGFAEGGAINRTTSTRQETPREATSPVVMVQPIQFNDEQSLDQALASGQKSFVRHARINRSELRVSLGLSGTMSF